MAFQSKHIPTSKRSIYTWYHAVSISVTILMFSLPQSQTQRFVNVEFEIQEQQPSGTEVGNIRKAARINSKVPPNERNKLSFNFLNARKLHQSASLFSINSDLGTVYTTAMIDRENVCEFASDCNVEFDVTIQSSVSGFFEIAEVRIVIKDINDNAPRFPNDEVTLFVQESVNINKELSIVGAIDKDKEPDNSVNRYEMKSEYPEVFRLKAKEKLDGTWDLKIVVLQNLDREQKDYYTLYIIAKDNGIPQRSGNVTVHINVTDDNDNAPMFSENVYRLEVREQARVNSVVGRVTATDYDRGLNAAVSYQFSAASGSNIDRLFYIDSNSGEIKVKKPLQYDAGKSFRTIVVASDRGNPPQASQTELMIRILDVGNTPPQISINPIPNTEDKRLAIRENPAMDTVVAHIKIKDRDKGANGVVDCRSISAYFKVLRFEGGGFLVQVARELDREKQDEYNVTIVCEDRGVPKLSDIGWFFIKLLDVNDCDPVFTQQIYATRIQENNKRGDHVLYVRAKDNDTGINQQLHYSISMKSSESSFTINERTGEITAGEIFDRETLSQVSFMVKVTDGGKPQRSGVASVVVNILDQNDQTPYFTSSMEFEIAEKLPTNAIVGKLKGADRDEGKNAEVSFHAPIERMNLVDEPVPFIVFPDGIIRTDQRLRRDVQERYKFPVIITDNGKPARSSTATVTIRVIESNEHAPTFIFPSRKNNTVKVKAEAQMGSVIATLRAMDGDTGRNAKLKYYIDTDYHSTPFAISDHNNGRIILTRDLGSMRKDSFKLNVSVHDQGIPVRVARGVLEVIVEYENGMSVGRMDGTGGSSSSRGNSTSVFGKTDIKYIIIAGVVGGLTIVIAFIIVVIIIFIRHPRRESRRGTPSGVQEQGDGRHFDKQIWQSVPVEDASPKRDMREKKLPSDLDLDHGNDRDYGDGCGGGGKSGNGDVMTNNSNANDLLDAYGRKHTMDTFQVQQPQLYTFKKGGLRGAVDDFQSDTSGETTTSDSGRGGSEEDIQLPPLPELREDTSRIIFKSPGSGLKDSRFIQPTYPGSNDGETLAFQTFSPRTLPSHYNSDRNNSSPSMREIHTLGHSNKGIHNNIILPRSKLVGPNNPSSSGRSTPSKANQGYYSTNSLNRPTSPGGNSLLLSHRHNNSTSNPATSCPASGPGTYPSDIPDKAENPYGKKVTFQTDLTTQNLRTWDLCQKMNIQPDAVAAASLSGNPPLSGDALRGQRPGYPSNATSRPRSHEDDDNTTTSGSYTITLDNDLDLDGLPPPYTTMA